MPVEKKAKAAAAKAKKVKLVRDSFCMPKEEYAELEALKQRLLALGKGAKKSELLRAGVLALVRAEDADLLAYINAVPNLKTGRPANTPEAAPEAEVQTPTPVQEASVPVPAEPVLEPKRPARRRAPSRAAVTQTQTS